MTAAGLSVTVSFYNALITFIASSSARLLLGAHQFADGEQMPAITEYAIVCPVGSLPTVVTNKILQ